ncbi:MAG: histidinol-phosphate transaminase, partial [Planctomyces sp.]|nr:histidinol-phosphate transaminase [Planctomyces sp.]
WIKLNTNENPYPPSPLVAEAIQKAAAGRLNLYPDPLATGFRRIAAEVYGVDHEQILPTNGSDEVLTIITRSFTGTGDLIAYPYPSYILYETLADLQNVSHQRLILDSDWNWSAERAAPVISRAKAVFVPNPNSPSGNCWSEAQITELVPPQGVLVLDGAYADFADEPQSAKILDSEIGDRLVLTRTFSKSYSLAGIRFGFAIARPEMIAGLRKVKDSYNCDSISLAAATAAISDQQWMLANVERIRATRGWLTGQLRELGFSPTPSQANFVWTTHPSGRHHDIYQSLKAKKILVRYMKFPGVDWAEGRTLDGLRITIGTREEVEACVNALREIV